MLKKRRKEYEEDIYMDEGDDDEIEIMDLVFILIRRWRIIASVMVPVVILGVVFAITRPSIYKSETTLIVSSGAQYSARVDQNEMTTNQKLVSTYTEIARSESIMRNVIKKLDLGSTPTQVAKKVKVSPVGDTEFIRISYTDADPRIAMLLVDEVSREFINRVRQVMNVQNLRVADKAELGKLEPKKRALILAISIVLGGMLGVFAAFVVEFLHSKLRKPEDIERVLGASVLANIPEFDLEDEGNGKRKIFFKGDQDSHIAEALRVLRTNVHFMNDESSSVIVTTSTVPKEGKSTVAANYAMSVALSGKKVLLVDCDIRRPRAHTSFDIEVEYGMGDVLLGKREAADVIIKDIEENLDLLPSKHLTNNVTELFLGDRMKQLIEEVRGKYDLVVLDTPPLMVATDAAIMSEYADGLIYVVGYDEISKKELMASKQILKRAGANILGCVVNKVEKSGYSYGNYGYYNYSYKYYKDYIGETEKA